MRLRQIFIAMKPSQRGGQDSPRFEETRTSSSFMKSNGLWVAWRIEGSCEVRLAVIFRLFWPYLMPCWPVQSLWRRCHQRAHWSCRLRSELKWSCFKAKFSKSLKFFLWLTTLRPRSMGSTIRRPLGMKRRSFSEMMYSDAFLTC